MGKPSKHYGWKARKSWRWNFHWQGRALCDKVSLYCWFCVIDKTKNDPICLNRISCDTDGWVVKSNKEKAYPTFLHIIPTVEIVDIQVKLKFIIVLTRFIFFPGIRFCFSCCHNILILIWEEQSTFTYYHPLSRCFFVILFVDIFWNKYLSSGSGWCWNQLHWLWRWQWE